MTWKKVVITLLFACYCMAEQEITTNEVDKMKNPNKDTGKYKQFSSNPSDKKIPVSAELANCVHDRPSNIDGAQSQRRHKRQTCAGYTLTTGQCEHDWCASKCSAVECPDLGTYNSAQCEPTASDSSKLDCKCYYNCAPTANTEVLTETVDIVIALDSSHSVGSTNYASEKQFVKNLISQTTISDYRATVGVMSFARYATFHFGLTPSQTAGALTTSIDAISYAAGLATNIDVALDMSKQMLDYGRETPSKKVIILITDGQHNVLGYDPVTRAQAIVAAGYSIVAVGMNGVSSSALSTYTGGNTGTILQTDFASLPGKAGDVLQMIADL